MSKELLDVRINKKSAEATGICSFELVEVNGHHLPSFSAGAHIDIHLPNGLIRQYSLCNNPAQDHRYIIAVLRDANSRGGSIAMHQLREGDVVQISQPRNNFKLASDATKYILLGGGIGITPLLSMAEALADQNAEFEMHYCTRSREATAFYDALKQSAFAKRVSFYFDDEDGKPGLDIAGLLAGFEPGQQLYVCGPGGFLTLVRNTATDLGWPDEAVHFEYFASEAEIHEAGDFEFQVKLEQSGRLLTIPADKTVLDVLQENQIDIDVSCEQGVCGTCVTRVVEGTPDHRDMFLTNAEKENNDRFTPCCSRSKSKLLVLDL